MLNNIVSFSIKRPITIFMMAIFAITLGVFFLLKMTPSVLPNIQKPTLVVVTSYPNQNPQIVEDEVTKVLEDSLNKLENIKFIKSSSSFGISTIQVEFNWGSDISIAQVKLKEILDEVKLPNNVLKPNIRKFSSSDLPVISFDLLSKSDENKFSKYIDDILRVKLERIDGVSKVIIYGISEQYIQIYIKDTSVYNISYSDLIKQINDNNIIAKIGKVYDGKVQDVLIVSKINSIDRLVNLSINIGENKTVLLKEIATVKIKNRKKDTITQVNFQNSIHVDIKKDSTYSSNEIINNVKKILKQEQLTFLVTKDDSIYIRGAQDSIVQNIILGIIFSTIIIILFMKNQRIAFIVSITAPLSIILSINILELLNIQRSIPMLSGLSIGTGLVIDSTVVFIENVYKHMNYTRNVKKAILNASNEVSQGIVTSSLTTIAVFFPMIFTQGLLGEIFYDLAIAVMSTIVCSLVVTFTIVPPLIVVFFRANNNIVQNNKIIFEDKLNVITKWILKSQKNRLILLASSALGGFMILSIAVLNPVFVFMPSGTQDTFILKIKYPKNHELKLLKEEANKIGNYLYETINSDETKISVVVDKSKITFTVRVPNKDVQNFVKILQKQIIKYTTASYEFLISSPVKQLMGGGKPVQLYIKNNDNGNLLLNYLEENNILINSTTANKNFQELSLYPKRNEIEEYKLDLGYISNELLSNIDGVKLKKLFHETKKYDIEIVGDIDSKEKLIKSQIASSSGSSHDFLKLLTTKVNQSKEQLIRYDKYDVIEYKSEFEEEKYSLSFIAQMITDKIQEYNIKAFFIGEIKESSTTLRQLILALVVSIVLIYMIMTALFESFIFPISIMFTVLLASSGAILSLIISGNNLSGPAFLGIIALAGIIVNNGIVLIEFINILRKRQLSRESAITQTILSRITPILITTLTSILGMLPMIFSTAAGSEMYQTMAIAMVGGMLIATPLTLFIVPTIYILLEDFSQYLKLIKIRHIS